METNMITMNEIISFICDAIDKNMKITVNNECYSPFLEITVYKNNVEYIEFLLSNDRKEISVITSLGSCKISVLDKEILAFKLLFEKVKEYSAEKAIHIFNNFFNEPSESDNKVVDINDLNDDDE